MREKALMALEKDRQDKSLAYMHERVFIVADRSAGRSVSPSCHSFYSWFKLIA